MRSLLFDIASFIYLIPLVVGLSKYPFLDQKEKRFFIFIVATNFCNILAYFTSSIGNNVYVAYLFNFLEMLILPLFLLSSLDQKRYKYVWGIALLGGISLICFEAFMREGGIIKYNNLSLTFAAISLSVLSIRHLLKLRFDPSIYDLSKSSVFWFTLGLGIYYLGSILIWAFTRVFQEQNLAVLSNLTYFKLSLIYISSLLYGWGFLIIKTKAQGFSSPATRQK